MPASIFGERFFGRRQPAWHRIGTVMDEDLTVSQAMQHVDVGFEIYTTPTYVEVNGQYIKTADLGQTSTGRSTSEYNAIMREPTTDDPQHRVLSVVGGQWTPIQTRELAEYLDPISKKYPVETIGAIGHGEKIFITLDAGERTIAGEHHHLYYLITDHRDGTGALTIAFTPVRVVCQNTLTTGLNSAKISTALKHNKQIKQDAQWWIRIMNNMLTSQDQVVAQLERLAHYKLEDGDVNKVLGVSYPEPSRPRKLSLTKDITPDDVSKDTWLTILNDTKDMQMKFEQKKENQDKIRNAALSRFHVFNDEQPQLANTPWALWQAVVETEDYRKGWEVRNTSSALFGVRAATKARAFKSVSALCN